MAETRGGRELICAGADLRCRPGGFADGHHKSADLVQKSVRKR